MTETTREIFEKYQVRKTKKQKQAFREFVKNIAEKEGYSFAIEKGSFGAKNVVIGDVEKAKVVYTAHYDTCARLPFPNFITPKCFWIYLLYQILLVVAFFVVAFLIGFVTGVMMSVFNIDPIYSSYFSLIIYWLILVLTVAGPANKNTANDNTSGVTTLIDIMNELPDEKKSEVAFVFFDLEESGLIGSSSFASKHKKIIKDKLLINFDCVSDGENILIILKKQAGKYKEILEEAFLENENVKVEVLTKSVFYPSDQASFPCGVGVATFKKTKRFNILYMNRIHTIKDTVYRQENIEFLTECAVKLVDTL